MLAIDSNIDRVNAISEDVQKALAVDVRDFQAFSSVVNSKFDEAIVGIGEDLESSILCTLYLKRIGIPVIRTKASSEEHAEILRSIGATQVIFPELETAHRLALRILNPTLLDLIPLARDYRLIDVAAPESFHQRSLGSLHFRNRFGVFVIAIKREADDHFVFLPGPDYVIDPADVLVAIGKESDIISLQGKATRDPDS